MRKHKVLYLSVWSFAMQSVRCWLRIATLWWGLGVAGAGCCLGLFGWQVGIAVGSDLAVVRESGPRVDRECFRRLVVKQVGM